MDPRRGSARSIGTIFDQLILDYATAGRHHDRRWRATTEISRSPCTMWERSPATGCSMPRATPRSSD